jgi:hypothetical protein
MFSFFASIRQSMFTGINISFAGKYGFVTEQLAVPVCGIIDSDYTLNPKSHARRGSKEFRLTGSTSGNGEKWK